MPLDAALPSSRVDGIEFEETAHSYTLNGVTAPISVTGLISKHFESFDGPAVVEQYFDRWKQKPASNYHELIQQFTNDEDAKRAILDSWEAKKNEACRLGTATHRSIELLLNGAPLEACGDPEIEVEINAFLVWHDQKVHEEGWSTVATELLVGGLDAEGQLCLGGAIDALFTNREGEYVLVDWKRTAKEFGPDEDTRFAKPGTGPVRELLDSKYNRYSLQLAVYSGMLKRCMGIDVGDRRYLVRLSGADGAQQIDASGAVFDRVAEALLREAGVIAPEEAAPASPKRQKV
jgi:ATP-dependent exoDNAse (exonuclease V) beta subunit